MESPITVQRFKSIQAEQLYEQTYLRAEDHPVRGFEFDWPEDSPYQVFYKTLKDFGLIEFVALPPPANLTLVREFYSNAHVRDGVLFSDTFVRDSDVSFTPRALRQLFNMPRVKDCNYQCLLVTLR